MHTRCKLIRYSLFIGCDVGKVVIRLPFLVHWELVYLHLFNPTDDLYEDAPWCDLDPGRQAIFWQLAFGEVVSDMGLYLSGLNQVLGDVRRRCLAGRKVRNAVYHGKFLSWFRVCLSLGYRRMHLVGSSSVLDFFHIQRRRQDVKHLDGAERLSQKSHGASSHRDLLLVLVAMRCNENDGKPTAPGLQLTLELQPAHSTHPNIEDQAIRPVEVDGTQEFFCREEVLHVQPIRHEETFNGLAHRWIIVYDRDHRTLRMNFHTRIIAHSAPPLYHTLVLGSCSPPSPACSLVCP